MSHVSHHPPSPPLFPPHPPLNPHPSKNSSTALKTHLLRLPSPHPPPDPTQTLPNPQDPINQQSIRGTLDLEVAEEGVGAVQVEDFVERVVAFVVGADGYVGGCGCGQGGEGVGWAAGAGSEGEEGDVSCDVDVSGVE